MLLVLCDDFGCLLQTLPHCGEGVVLKSRFARFSCLSLSPLLLLSAVWLRHLLSCSPYLISPCNCPSCIAECEG